MWTCASPAPPGPPPTANPTSPSTSASPIATAPTCANATSPSSPNCDPKEIAAIELALRFKEDLAALGSLDSPAVPRPLRRRRLDRLPNRPAARHRASPGIWIPRPTALEEASRLDGCYVLKTDLP